MSQTLHFLNKTTPPLSFLAEIPWSQKKQAYLCSGGGHMTWFWQLGVRRRNSVHWGIQIPSYSCVRVGCLDLLWPWEEGQEDIWDQPRALSLVKCWTASSDLLLGLFMRKIIVFVFKPLPVGCSVICSLTDTFSKKCFNRLGAHESNANELRCEL